MAAPQDVSYLTPAFNIKLEGTALTAEQLNIVTSVTVTKGIGKADHFSFEVQDIMENGQFKWLGNDLFKMGKKVNISLGYAGKTGHTIEAHIDTISPSFSSGMAPTFKVEGSHKGFTLMTEDSELKDYSEKKDSAIISEIAGVVGLGSEVDTTEEAEPDAKEFKDAGQSYWSYIGTIAARNKEFEYFVDDGKLYFRKAKVGDSPVLTLTWGQHLLSFSTSVDVSKLYSEVIVLSRNGPQDTDIEGKATAGSENLTKLGSKFGSELAKEAFDGKKIKYMVKGSAGDKSEADGIALAKLESGSLKLISGTCKSLGFPAIKPGVVVELKGLGDIFSGKYYVSDSTHTIGSSGYDCSFSIWRNAL